MYTASRKRQLDAVYKGMMSTCTRRHLVGVFLEMPCTRRACVYTASQKHQLEMRCTYTLGHKDFEQKQAKQMPCTDTKKFELDAVYGLSPRPYAQFQPPPALPNFFFFFLDRRRRRPPPAPLLGISTMSSWARFRHSWKSRF